MNRFKNSKTWLVLALYALISVTAGPLLAASCCCASEAKIRDEFSVSAAGKNCHQPSPAVVAKPSCHISGTSATQCGKVVSRAAQNTQQAYAQPSSPCAESPRKQVETAIGRQCLCHAATGQSILFDQAKSASKAPAFAQSALPSRPFAPVVAPVIERWSFAPASRLFSKFFFVSLLGRAPPAV